MQNVLITGTGRPQALGFNLAKRYLEHGDRVFACVRKSTDAFAELLSVYPEALTVLVMDIMDTPSVRAASEAVAAHVDCIDTLIKRAESRIITLATRKATLNCPSRSRIVRFLRQQKLTQTDNDGRMYRLSGP